MLKWELVTTWHRTGKSPCWICHPWMGWFKNTIDWKWTTLGLLTPRVLERIPGDKNKPNRTMDSCIYTAVHKHSHHGLLFVQCKPAVWLLKIYSKQIGIASWKTKMEREHISVSLMLLSIDGLFHRDLQTCWRARVFQFEWARKRWSVLADKSVKHREADIVVKNKWQNRSFQSHCAKKWKHQHPPNSDHLGVFFQLPALPFGLGFWQPIVRWTAPFNFPSLW